MKMMFALICFAAISGTASADVVAAPNPATYTWINANIIQPKCIGCHKKLFKTYDSLVGTVKAGRPQDSNLYKMTKSGMMPENGEALTDAELNAIQSWIADGAKNN